MKKVFPILLLAGAPFMPAGAQQRTHALQSNPGSWNKQGMYAASKTTGIVVDTLLPVSFTSNSNCQLTVYTASDSGYVAGNNNYGDKEKLMRYELQAYGYVLPTTVNSVSVFFAAKHVGGNSNLTAKIYSSNGSGQPATLLGTSTPKTVSSIDTTGGLTVFIFPNPVALTTTQFFASVDVSALNAAGDTVGIVSTVDGCPDTDPASAWEMWADGTFHLISDASNWGITFDMGIFPGVSAHTAAVSNVARDLFRASCYPVPATGNFTVSFTGISKGTTTVTLKDLTGKTVMQHSISTAQGDTYTVPFDATALSSGIYFCEISSGNERGMMKVSVR